MRRKKRPQMALQLTTVFLCDNSNLSLVPPINKIPLFFPTHLMLSVQHLGPVHEAHFLWGFKADLERDLTPILAPGLLSLTATELGSMAPPPAQRRRSSRQGRGLNGRDVQLDNLGDILTAPTRQAKKRFAPSDGLSLPNNLLAPVPKKRQRKKVIHPYCPSSSMLMATRQHYHHPQHRRHVNNHFLTLILVLGSTLYNPHPLLYLLLLTPRPLLSRLPCRRPTLPSTPLRACPQLFSPLTHRALPPPCPTIAQLAT